MIKKILKKKEKEEVLTPEKARKIATKAVVTPTTYIDCLNDIQLRSERGYTWTYMLKVEDNVIDDLLRDGWKVRIEGTNHLSKTSMIKITW